MATTLDASQTLLVRRLEDSFATDYLIKAAKAMPVSKKISYALGLKTYVDEVAENAINLMMHDLADGKLCDLYADKIVKHWDNYRTRLIGAEKIGQQDELKNIEKLKGIFNAAHESGEIVQRPEYMNNFYDPIRLRARK